MKNIILLAALAIGMGAHAADAKKDGNADVSFSGEYRVRYTTVLNSDGQEDGAGSEAMTEGRFKIGATFRMGEKVTGHTTLLMNHQFGQTGSLTTANNQDPDASISDNVEFNEAFANWVINDDVTMKVGRFGWEMADGSVISIDDYQNTPNAFEGVLVGYDQEFAKFNIFGFEHYDEGASTADDKDSSSFGVSADLKTLPEFFKMANIHLIQQSADHTATADGANLMRYGVTVGGATAGVDYKFTYAGYTGDFNGDATELDATASMMDLEVGYKMEDLMKLRVWVGYHTDTGDDAGTTDEDEGYHPYFYDSHKNAGLADVVGWGNLTDTQVGVSFTPMDNLDVGLVYHMFAATEKTGGDNITGPTWTADTTESAIGSEIDLLLNHKYDNNVNIAFRYSTFAPGARYDASPAENYDSFWLQGSVGF